MATYGTDVPVTADDAAQVQKATRGAFADTGTVPAESFTAKVQSAADKNEAMKTDREDYVSLKEVLMQNPPLEEESREISKKVGIRRVVYDYIKLGVVYAKHHC
ncbi:hypothetical protein EON63_05170 [archaeon]|nr:MAG: hypothetical protein EON63_05170 [archaeon]